MYRASGSSHGVLLSVAGRGVLILGESGTGKSELALELIASGHRLVADDVVEWMHMNGGCLEGFAPERFAGLIHVWGLGVFDVRRVFGESSYQERVPVEMCIDLDFTELQDPLSRPVSTRIGAVDIPTFAFSQKQRNSLRLLIETAVKLVDTQADVDFRRLTQRRDEIVAAASGE